MSVSAAALSKTAAAVLSDERGRKAAGWVLTAILSPVILLVAFLCALGSGGADHNNAAVKASFYGTAFADSIPPEFQKHISEMRTAFSSLDSAVASVNADAEDGTLDAVRVKSIFYALCFGEDAPTERAANNFVGCFYTTETRTRTIEVTDEETGETSTEEEEYTVNVPVSLETAYANVAALLDREIMEDDRSNASHIYTMIAGPIGGYAPSPGTATGVSGGGGWWTGYERGTGFSTDFDGLVLAHPETKNAADLAAYAIYAWENGWGYTWGTIGYVMTPGFLDSKAAQYPEGVGDKRDIIERLWMGKRTTDCVGLIKSYGWYNPETQTIDYNTNGMPDFGANQMYYTASESGTIDTLPEIPGLAVWQDGHIGVYIGNGEIVEAAGTAVGIIKTKVAQRDFTHWLKVAYIDYDK